MVLAYSHRSHSTLDERHARQIALLVALAAHLFVFVWLLRNYHSNSAIAVEPPAMVLVDFYRTPKHAAPTPTSGTHRKSFVASNSSGSTTRFAEHRLAVSEGSEAINISAEIGIAQAPAGHREVSAGGTGGSVQSAVFHAPRVLHRAPAIYPVDAYDSQREGESEVLVTIGADGSLIDARISRSSGSESLDRATLEAVRKYTFRAADKGGESVEAQAYLVVAWQITAAIRYQFDKRLIPSEDRKELEALAEERSVHFGAGTTGLDNHGKDKLDARTARPIEKQP